MDRSNRPTLPMFAGRIKLSGVIIVLLVAGFAIIFRISYIEMTPVMENLSQRTSVAFVRRVCFVVGDRPLGRNVHSFEANASRIIQELNQPQKTTQQPALDIHIR